MLFRRAVLAVVLPVAPFVLSAGAPFASAQTGRGTLTGTVVDAAGAALQGARVTLNPGNATATTDATGQFTVLGVTAGAYTVEVSYSGFKAFSASTTVVSGQPARLDATLTVASSTQNVDVYAGRQGGEIEAINRTFNADNIINVLPADVITSLPNANIADAIGRLPSVTLERDEGEGKYVKIRGTEPRLTHITLDGVNMASPETVRQIKLDIIPADLVESVQINKTLQANIEGDGIGGSVDLRTKSAEDRPTVSLEALGGYNPILGGIGNDQFDGTLGKRFLANHKLGLLGSGSYDYNGRGINDVEPGPALAGTYDLRDYKYFRDRQGFGGTLDYRFTDTSSIYLKGLYSHFNNFGDDWIYSPAINSFTSQYQGGNDGSISFSALRRRPVQDIGGLQLGGHHVVRQSLFSWDVDSSIGRTRDNGYATAHFSPQGTGNTLNAITYGLDVSHPLTPHINVQDGQNIFDPTKYFYTGQSVQYFYNPEVDLGFGASLTTPYKLAGHASTFEFGGRFRNVHKFVNQNTQSFIPTAANAADPSLAQSNFLNSFSDPGYYGGNYKFGPAVDYGKVLSFPGQALDPANTIVGNSFNQIEKVSAGYIMNTTDLGRFRLVLGLRFENTGENNLGYDGESNPTRYVGTTPIRVQYSYLDVLPSASLRYALTPTQGLRVVYGRGLSRPQFSDLIPFQTVTSSGSARTTVSKGNPNIRAEYADNIDVLYENNLPHTGLLQAGFFYKNLSNPILPTQTLVAPDPALTGNNLPYLLGQTVNAGSAYVYGCEISYQQRLTYLPGMLNGFGVSANYGYTASQAKFPAYIDPTVLQPGQISGPNRGPEGANPALIGQAPNSFNFSPTYDKGGLSVRLGATYNQANIAAYQYTTDNSGPIVSNGQGAQSPLNPVSGGGPKGPTGDNYFYSHFQVDLQGTYKLPKGFSFVASALNLTNEVFGFYNGSTIYPVQREFYRQTFNGGIRWSPSRESR